VKLSVCHCERLHSIQGFNQMHQPWTAHHALQLDFWTDEDDHGRYTSYRLWLIFHGRIREIKPKWGEVTKWDDYCTALAEGRWLVSDHGALGCPFARAKVTGTPLELKDGEWVEVAA
jgi:hypothetical protein